MLYQKMISSVVSVWHIDSMYIESEIFGYYTAISILKFLKVDI
ncbi:hypothetical protein OCHUTO_0655 [Orientia chuto str. Dubai]|uniref:Uncharacterized protein n=1 Tax=Orientia chuto str. Dubai TaxID=1359168 RepID=A0A0F3MMW3_9RICK|nr:hypothetical protein OCHUTO_0655 [Orientia chuto str. Dubai]